MSKQTAIQWLVENYLPLKRGIELGHEPTVNVVEQANEMFEEQIIDAWLSAWKDSMINPLEDKYYQPEAEQYYNETFNK
jgi:hypothetical protein